MRVFFNLLTTSFTNWSKDGAPRLGAALAFYTFFSISPMLLIMIAVAGFVFGREAVQGELINQLTSLMGREAARLLNDTLIATSGREENVLASLIALVITIIGATGFFCAASRCIRFDMARKENFKFWLALYHLALLVVVLNDSRLWIYIDGVSLDQCGTRRSFDLRI